MSSMTACLAAALVAKLALQHISFFTVAKNDSATVLSCSRRCGCTTGARRWCAPTRERPVVYWELLSLQNMAFPATYLRDFADSSAATAMSAVMRSESNRQPPCACTGRPRRLGRASPPQYEGMLSRRPACRWKRGS